MLRCPRSLIFSTILLGWAFAPQAAEADRIIIRKPLDLEAQRERYDELGMEFPEEILRRRARENAARLDALVEGLAPVELGTDRRGSHYFQGRILKTIPPVDPSAVKEGPDRYPKILFEAYGKDGKTKSRKPVLISTEGLRVEAHLDTVADLVRLLSNRHEVLGVPFGSEAHRETLFAALDPDGSLGLPAGAALTPSGAIQEGALVRFASAGALSCCQPRSEGAERFRIDPTDPILLFTENWKRGGGHSIELPFDFIDEVARAQRYPGYEPEFLAMAQETVRIFYTLAIATPDLATPRQRDRATRLNVLGLSTMRALANALRYHHADEAIRANSNEDRPLMTLTTEDVRRTALDILEGGPVVPATGALTDEPPAAQGLLQVMERNPGLAARASAILERYVAPMPGESRDVTELYAPDRHVYRTYLQELAIFDHDMRAARILARIGWGTPNETVKLVEHLMDHAIRAYDGDAEEELHRAGAIKILRLVSRAASLARPDRKSWAAAAAPALSRRLSSVRAARMQGNSGSGDTRFLELWDSGAGN